MGNVPVRILEAPSPHTPDTTLVYIPSDRVLFLGDATLGEFPFDTITVQMILSKAEVSRKTFYKYYADKYELMELYFKSFMDERIQSHYNGHNWEDILCDLYDLVKMEDAYFRHVNDINSQDNFWSFLREYSHAFYSKIKLKNENREFGGSFAAISNHRLG